MSRFVGCNQLPFSMRVESNAGDGGSFFIRINGGRFRLVDQIPYDYRTGGGADGQIFVGRIKATDGQIRQAGNGQRSVDFPRVARKKTNFILKWNGQQRTGRVPGHLAQSFRVAEVVALLTHIGKFEDRFLCLEVPNHDSTIASGSGQIFALRVKSYTQDRSIVSTQLDDRRTFNVDDFDSKVTRLEDKMKKVRTKSIKPINPIQTDPLPMAIDFWSDEMSRQ